MTATPLRRRGAFSRGKTVQASDVDAEAADLLAANQVSICGYLGEIVPRGTISPSSPKLFHVEQLLT
jgi:hypothetical protein